MSQPPEQYPGAQGYPGQPYPGQQPHPGQSGQQYPGQGYPGQGQPGPGYGGQGQPGQGYGGPPGSGYGGPGHPGGGYPEPGRSAVPGGAPPRSVQTSFQLWVAYLVLGVIAMVVSFLTRDAQIDAGIRIALEGSGFTEADLPAGTIESIRAAGEAQSNLSLVISIVILAVLAAAVVWMRKGRNWARIVLTVVGVLALLAGVFLLLGAGLLLAVGGLGVVSVLLAAVQVALAIAAMVFMYRPDAKAFFAAAR
ncbi:hypothetical protein [Pseudonocardia sp.]|uniref:hypothetical protein n=1 Tax=Pseudonocardia sp. TaxID=60912 RepID=UPI00260EC8D8|nr:hypothetical protein [Pseudonocardia sp.]